MEFPSPAPSDDPGGSTTDPDQIAELRERCQKMADREQRIVALLGCGSPDRIEHDLRNVMNELQLLRTVFEKQEG